MTTDAAMKRQVWLLLFCQALMHTTIVGQAVMVYWSSDAERRIRWPRLGTIVK